MREEILALAEGQRRLEEKLNRALELLTALGAEPEVIEETPHPLTAAIRKMHDDARRPR